MLDSVEGIGLWGVLFWGEAIVVVNHGREAHEDALDTGIWGVESEFRSSIEKEIIFNISTSSIQLPWNIKFMNPYK